MWHPDSGKVESVAVYETNGNRVSLPIQFDPSGSVFVVFRKVAVDQDRVTGVTLDGKAITLPVERAAQDSFRARVSRGGRYTLATASGHTLVADVPQPPAALTVAGPWDVSFPPNLGAPPKVTFEKLISLSEHPAPGVKYFSGTATYRKTFDMPAEMLGKGHSLLLDLGDVQVSARVKLNGKDLGILWKPPYQVEINETAKAGQNSLEIEVANLWVNRLIGDEQLPEDCTWKPGKWGNGRVLAEYPQWLLDGKPSPTGRVAFTTWWHYKKNDPLVPSGLIGPVRLEVLEMATFH